MKNKSIRLPVLEPVVVKIPPKIVPKLKCLS